MEDTNINIKEKHEATLKTWLCRKEVADMLGVHPYTIGRWEAQGKIRPVRFSRRLYRYDAETIREFAQKGIN
ncbi:MAG: helix-turn-helix domain-containing protein [Victivallales bacterium]|nr:helix-turn-helix domain-containing protein [Victivallales bacterium]